MAREIFISYSRKDLEKVKAIKAEIEKTTGAECWMDLEGGIVSGEDYVNRIVEGIENCRIFLFMLSSSSQESKNAIGELDGALKQQGLKGIHVVIVNIDDCDLNMRFTIKYSTLDIIAWQKPPQREKLLRDLKAWTSTGTMQLDDVQKALMHLEGRGVQKSVRKAYELLRKTADQGNTRAQYLLGKMLLENYVYFDVQKEAPSTLENARWCSLHGIHLEPEKNYEQARKYLDRAAAKQYKGAKELAAEAERRKEKTLRLKEETLRTLREQKKRNETKDHIATVLKNFGVEVAEVQIYLPPADISLDASSSLAVYSGINPAILTTPPTFDVILKDGYPMRRIELLLDDIALALKIRKSQIHILSPEKFRIEMGW